MPSSRRSCCFAPILGYFCFAPQAKGGWAAKQTGGFSLQIPVCRSVLRAHATPMKTTACEFSQAVVVCQKTSSERPLKSKSAACTATSQLIFRRKIATLQILWPERLAVQTKSGGGGSGGWTEPPVHPPVKKDFLTGGHANAHRPVFLRRKWL